MFFSAFLFMAETEKYVTLCLFMDNGKQHIAIGVITTVCRFVLAVVFIFSGFVKAIDPLGTQYKIQDYLNALGWAGIFPDSIPFIASAHASCFADLVKRTPVRLLMECGVFGAFVGVTLKNGHYSYHVDYQKG